jgi:hypothetical protein
VREQLAFKRALHQDCGRRNPNLATRRIQGRGRCRSVPIQLARLHRCGPGIRRQTELRSKAHFVAGAFAGFQRRGDANAQALGGN